MRPLTNEQVEQFRRQGFLAVPDFTNPEDVTALRPIYDRLFREEAGAEDGNFFDFVGPAEHARAKMRAPQLMNPSRYAPELLESPIANRALALARQVLGPTARLGFDHALRKTAGMDAPTPWHQDEAFWRPWFDHDALSVWIPLQAVDAENGCMAFVPGSHHGRVMEHRKLGGDRWTHALEAPGADGSRAVACPLPLGGVTIHHARTLHHSPANRSGGDRSAYALVFIGRTRRRLVPRNHHWDPDIRRDFLKRAAARVQLMMQPRRRAIA